MEDWKERLQAEYAQLKERYEKLHRANIKIEVGRMMQDTTARDEYHRGELMGQQEEVMRKYLHILELRAELENIEL